MDPSKRIDSSSAIRLAMIVLCAVTILASAWVHRCAGFTLPIPWDDEIAMVWPAAAWSENGTLLAPQLNPDRDVMWMPPGYMLIVGVLFKLTGVSLVAARWLSWGFTIAGYFCLVAMLRRYPYPLASAVVASLFLLNGTFVTAGNIARMDSLIFLMAAAGFLLLQRGRVWTAFGLLAFGPLVHPNGVYVGAAALAWTLLLKGFRWGRPSRWDVALVTLAVVAWVGYFAYVARQWDGFTNDMKMQLARKAGYSPLESMMETRVLLEMAWYAGLAVLAFIRRRDWLLPLAFGGCCYLIIRLGHEMWYEIFNHGAFLIAGLAGIWFAGDLLQRRLVLSRGAACLLALPILAFYYRHGYIEGPKGYPMDMQWGWGMTMTQDSVEYMTDADVEAVAEALAAVAPADRTTRIAFYPQADALLMADAIPAGGIPYEPHFTSTRPDYLVYRESRYIPSWWRSKGDSVRARLDPSARLVRERDGTERWWVGPYRGEGS